MRKIVLLLLSAISLLVLSGCNSGTDTSLSSNNLSSKVNLSAATVNPEQIMAEMKLKGNDSIKINYTLDGEPLHTGTMGWGDMGWHLLTLTVESVPQGSVPAPVKGVIAIAGNPTDNPYGETATVNDINCGSATFAKVGDMCSVYLKVDYNYTTYPNQNLSVKVSIYPHNWKTLSDGIVPKDNIVSQSSVGIYRPIHGFETQYYRGSAISRNPGQYRMLLVENGNLNLITLNNLSPITNPNFTHLHRTVAGNNNDPVYGQWNECSLTANPSLGQVATLQGVNQGPQNSSCVVVYQAAITSTAQQQTGTVTLGTSASNTFPIHAGSYTLTANYSGGGQIAGINWNQSTLPQDINWDSVTYGNGTFVAISLFSDAVAYSTDGVHWNQSTLPPNNSWDSVTYGNGRFVAIAGNPNDAVAYSIDGIHWNRSVSPQNDDWDSVTYGNGIFVTIGDGSRTAAYSTDGIHWNSSILPNSGASSITYGNGRFVAVNFINNAIYSNDSIHWNRITLPPISISDSSWKSVTYGNGKFVAISSSSNLGGFPSSAIYSIDGIHWNQSTLPLLPQGQNARWEAVSYGGNLFVAVPSNASDATYSIDGIHWNQSTLPLDQYGDAEFWTSITYGNGKFVAISGENAAYGEIIISPENLSNFVINTN